MADDAENMSFLEHLEQLRKVLQKILAGFLIACFLCWPLSERVLAALLRYAAPEGFQLHYFSLMEPFVARLEVTAFLALVLSLPWSGWCLWRFLEPALKREERGPVVRTALGMGLLALTGAALALGFIVPSLVRFSLSFASPEMQPVIGIGDFTGLVLLVLLAAMALFQFPLLLYLLLLVGVLDVAQLRRKRPLVIVVIFVLAALFSPPDVLSQLLLAVPAWLLFEAGMVFFNRRFPVCGEPDEVYRETGGTGTDENGGEDV